MKNFYRLAVLSMAATLPAAYASADIVSRIPENAQIKEYTFEGSLFTTFWGSTFPVEENMLPAQMAFDGDDVYWKNPLIGTPVTSWLKGTVSDGKLSFEMGQQLGPGRYAELLTRVNDDTEKYDYAVPNTDEIRFLTFSVSEEGVLTMEDTGGGRGDFILGAVDGEGKWLDDGVFEVVLTPFTDKLVEAPATLELSDWVMGYDGGSRKVKGGFDGKDFYVQGMSEKSPEAWLKGSLDNGTVSFESGQYVGIDPTLGYRLFMYGAETEMVYNPSLGSDIPSNELLPAFTMAYDGATSVMTAREGLLFCAGEVFRNMGAYTQLVNVTLRPVSETVDFTPRKPLIADVQVFPQYPDEGWDCVDVYLSDVNVDGQQLDTSNIYYRILLDGEPYILDPDEFDGVDEPMEWIPFDFESYDLEMLDGTGRSVSIYISFVDEYGVQEKYVDGDKEYLSEIATYSMSGIREVSDAEVVGESWFDASGRQVLEPGAGFYIKVTRLADGKTRASKAVRK